MSRIKNPAELRSMCLALIFALGAGTARSHGDEQHPTPTPAPGYEDTHALLSIEPGAIDALAALERFWTSLLSGDAESAGAELDPSLLVLENGGGGHTRDDYLDRQFSHDAAFLIQARVVLKQRSARISGDLAWISSERAIAAKRDRQELRIVSTETAVLRRSADGWRIVHLHWSSRPAESDG